MSNVVIINGSNASTSRLTAIQQYIEKTIENVKVIEVFQLPAQDLISANYLSDAIKEANELVEQADTVVVITPVYKAAYSGILKTYLDLIPQKGLEHKTVLPIAVGGSIGHLLSLEYALKPVLSVLGATEILNSVYIVDQQIERLENGHFNIQDEAVERLNQELQKLKNSKTIYSV